MNNTSEKSQYVMNVYARIKKVYNLKTDAELALHLGIKPNVLAMQKKRGKLDYEQIITKCDDVSLDYLLRSDEALTAMDGLGGHSDEDSVKYAVESIRNENSILRKQNIELKSQVEVLKELIAKLKD